MKNQNNDRFNFQKNIDTLNSAKEYPTVRPEQVDDLYKKGFFVERENGVVEYHTREYKVVLDDITFDELEWLAEHHLDKLKTYVKGFRSTCDEVYLKKPESPVDNVQTPSFRNVA